MMVKLYVVIHYEQCVVINNWGEQRYTTYKQTLDRTIRGQIAHSKRNCIPEWRKAYINLKNKTT